MGTTAEKLQKVLDTKNDIKAAIRETGTTVLDDETFASYPDKIRNNLVKPAGNVDITNTNSTDVSHAATAQIKDVNLIASNIKENVVVLGITGTYVPPYNAVYTGIDDPAANLGEKGDIYIKTYNK